MSSNASPLVGSEVLFENDRIRVWDLRLGPGEEVNLHRHENDYAFVCVTPGRVTVLRDGRDAETTEVDDGYVEYTEVGQGIEHTLRNTGGNEYREILIELKGPSASPEPQDPEDNGRSR
jgi:hypothetical protein